MRPLNDADLRETSTFEILGEENTETMCSRRQSLFALVKPEKKRFSEANYLCVVCVMHSVQPRFREKHSTTECGNAVSVSVVCNPLSMTM